MTATAELSNPLDHVDELVAVFAAAGKPRDAAWFRWYYEDKGLGTPVSWLLRASGSRRIVGLITLVPRRLRLGDEVVNVGLVGNLLIDANARQGFSMHQFGKLVLTYEQHGFQMMMAVNPNPAAAKMARYYGLRAVGTWMNCVHIARSAAWLGNRLGVAGAVMGPLVDVGAAARRLWTSHRDPFADRVEVRQIGPEELRLLSPERWASSPGQFVGEMSAVLLEKQFLSYPGRNHVMFAFYVPGNAEPAGVAAVAVYESAGRASVQFVSTDRRHLTAAQAIRALIREAGRTLGGVWRVEVIQGAPLQQELLAAGFVTDGRAARANANSFWVHARRKSELMKRALDPASWLMFQGFNDV